MKERKKYIDVYKGLAILFVLMGHLTFFMFNMTEYNSFTYLKYLYLIIYLFHMPFFFGISGYLENKIQEKDFKTFFIKGFFSLIIPYILFSYLLITINLILHNPEFSIFNYLTVFYKSVSNLWFIYALFFIKIIEYLFYKFIKKENLITLIWIILFIISLFLKSESVIHNTLIFGISFHFGLLIYKNKKFYSTYYLLSILISVLGTIIYFKYNENLGKTMVGISLLFVLIELGKKFNLKNNFLEFLGKNTMIIFIIDGFTGVPLIRILQLVGINSSFIVLVLCIILKLIISFIVIKISEKIRFIKNIFYPYNIISNKK